MIPFRSKKYQKQQCKELTLREEQLASQWIMRREQLPEYRFALEMMSQEEKETVFWESWPFLDDLAQRDLVRATYSEGLDKLLKQYDGAAFEQKLQVLEALGYLYQKEAVDFLMVELCRPDENLRLAAAGALQKQDPELIIEPMLAALEQPEQFLAARIYNILSGLGPRVVPLLLQKFPEAELNGKIMMVQLLGAFGDKSVLPILVEAAGSNDYLLKKVAIEALVTLGVESTWQILQEFLRDEHWQIRLLVTEAFRRANITAVCPELRLALCREKDTLVRETMEEVLYALDIATEDVEMIWSRRRSKQYGRNGRRSS